MIDKTNIERNTARRRNSLKNKKSKKTGLFGDLKYVVCVALVVLSMPIFVFGHYSIPSENMQPTLEVGDHVYVNKLSYGISRHSLGFNMHKWPMFKAGRVFAKTPKRGDVVVFRSPKEPKLVMIKRLIGLPGDEIEMRQGRLIINGKLVERFSEEQFSYRQRRGSIANVTRYKEQFMDKDKAHWIYERNDKYPLDNVGPFVVPENKFFVMGDNRDNSNDSRSPSGPGFVPFDNLIGRVVTMVYSTNYCKAEDALKCPPPRSFIKL